MIPVDALVDVIVPFAGVIATPLAGAAKVTVIGLVTVPDAFTVMAPAVPGPLEVLHVRLIDDALDGPLSVSELALQRAHADREQKQREGEFREYGAKHM